MTSRHNSPAPGRAGRLARSRAACEACHRVKQRCDGPSVCPCHRCKTWGIECIFPSSVGPVSSKSTLGKSTSASSLGSSNGKGKASASSHKAAVVPSSSPSTRAAAAASSSVDSSPASAFATATAPPTPPTTTASIPIELAQQLRVMMARLESIEGTLARAEVSFPTGASGASLAPQHHRASHSHSGQTVSDETPLSTHYSSEHHKHQPNSSNPVEAAGEAIEAMAVEGLVGLSDSNQTRGSGVPETWDPARPDVLSRSLMTVEECEREFDVYFNNLHPWALSLSSSLDRNPLTVRARSPLLFHSILLICVYYRDRTPENTALYQSISAIVDSILAPTILCPQPDQLSSDFIRSIHLLTLYKPLPIAMFHARGVRDLSAIEHASKMNVRASWLLRLIASRVAMFIGLPSITTTFARAFANQHEAPIPQSIINEQRLYFGCVFHESHGALQSGKPSNFVPQDALKSTRLFATHKAQASDVRLAASVELAAAAASILANRRDGDWFDREDLYRFEDEMAQWTEYWQPILAANEVEDQLSWTAAIPYQAFIRVVVHGYSFARWKNAKKELAASLQPAPPLSEQEHDSLQAAVDASAAILLAASIEGKRVISGKGVETSWDGVKETLTVDPNVADKLKWASDSLTCVLFSYPLIFLAKLANEGLLLTSFSILSPSTQPAHLAPLSRTDKLCLLLHLGANLLESIAPNPSHPAVKQGAFLRRIREAGISGRRSVISAPGSPRLTVSSSTRDVGPSSTDSKPSLTTTALGPNGGGGSYNDFLSSSWDPSPMGSPRNDDPFGALLSGVEPSLMFASGQTDLFGIDQGFASVDWDGLEMGSSVGAGTGTNGQTLNGVQGARSMFSGEF